MKVKAIISDLDGTLLNQYHTIGEFTKKTLQKVANLDIPIILATGRNFFDVKHIRNNAGINAHIISSNGASLHDDNDELLYQNNISTDIVQELFKFKYDYKSICLNSYQDEHWFLDRHIEEFDRFFPDSKYKYKVVDFTAHKSIHNVQKLCYISQNHQKLEELSKIILREFSDYIDLTVSSYDCVEIMNKHVNKGATLQKLLNDLSINSNDCIAFGDNLNDYEMLSFVGHGVIMENANPKLKDKLPQCQQIASNHEESIASYLTQLLNLQ